jgi:hypothetical protein
MRAIEDAASKERPAGEEQNAFLAGASARLFGTDKDVAQAVNRAPPELRPVVQQGADDAAARLASAPTPAAGGQKERDVLSMKKRVAAETKQSILAIGKKVAASALPATAARAAPKSFKEAVETGSANQVLLRVAVASKYPEFRKLAAFMYNNGGVGDTAVRIVTPGRQGNTDEDNALAAKNEGWFNRFNKELVITVKNEDFDDTGNYKVAVDTVSTNYCTRF